jgi:hypothetical protein
MGKRLDHLVSPLCTSVEAASGRTKSHQHDAVNSKGHISCDARSIGNRPLAERVQVQDRRHHVHVPGIAPPMSSAVPVAVNMMQNGCGGKGGIGQSLPGAKPEFVKLMTKPPCASGQNRQASATRQVRVLFISSPFEIVRPRRSRRRMLSQRPRMAYRTRRSAPTRSWRAPWPRRACDLRRSSGERDSAASGQLLQARKAATGREHR